MCEAGLHAAQASFVYRNHDSKCQESIATKISLHEAFSKERLSTCEPLETFTYTNFADVTTPNANINPKTVSHGFPLASPTDNGKTLLYGQDAIDQVNRWLEYGCLEPSAANHATRTFLKGIDVLSDGTKDAIFCVLGITSELSPTKPLLQYVLNSHVIGVSRNINPLTKWYQNLRTQQPAGAALSNTTLQVTSADMLTQGPAIAKWIVQTVKSVANKKKLVLLPMGYMDGEANVRLTMAMDNIIMYVINELSSSKNINNAKPPEGGMHQRDNSFDITVAFWTSPSTVYVIPTDVAQDAYNRYQQETMNATSADFTSTLFQILPRRLLSMLSFGKILQPSSVVKAEQRKQQQQQTDNNASTNTKHEYIICNGVSNFQGPNYLLAKMLQQWRCMILLATGINVYAPAAPAARTVSVTHSAQAAAAIEGMPYIAPPVLTFDVDTCATLMTSILLNQVSDSSREQLSFSPERNPLEIFWDGSVHGGIWRCPYDINSVGIPAYLIGKFLIASNQAGSCPSAALASSTKKINERTTSEVNEKAKRTENIV